MKNLPALKTRAYHALVFQKVISCLLYAGLLLLLPRTLSASVVFGPAPPDQTVCVGSPATFSVAATGAAALIYQWQVSTNGGSTWATVTDGATYSGATTMTLRIAATTVAFNNFKYRCVVSDGTPGNSSAATLRVNAGSGPVPSLAGNLSQTQCAFTTGISPLNPQSGFNYQWQISTDGTAWTDLDPSDPVYSGTTDAVLQWDGSQTTGTAFLYRYTMTDAGSGCSAISAIDTIRIAPAPNSLVPSPPSTSVCPAGAPIASGPTTFTFTSPPSGYAFHWQESSDNGVNYSDLSNNGTYSGTNSPALSLTGITTPKKYRARTSLTTFNLTCETFSSPATLTIKTLPAITAQPADQFVCASTSPKIGVTGGGSNITYQWQTDNGTNGAAWANVSTGATGATTNRVTLNSVTTGMDGYKYKVIVGGPCGAAQTSSAVTLHIGASGTWLGAQDTAWEHAGNWCSIVPLQTTDVLVPSWAPRMPLISSGTGTAYSQSLTIQSGASLTISGGSNSMTGPFNIAGTVSYTANADQLILPADHGSLNISGSGNKSMQTNVGISNTFGLGGTAKLVTGSNILTMKVGSNPIVMGSATSWIVTGNGGSGAANTGLGGLRMAQVPAAASNLLFPVGPTPTAFNVLLLTNSGTANDFTVAVKDQPVPGGPAGSVVNRTWLVSAAGAGGSISLALQWNQAEEPVTFDRSNAAVMRSDGAQIVQKGAAAPASGANPYLVSGGSFSSITQFGVGNNNMIILPVQLASFSGQWIDEVTAGLSWVTDPQYDAASFKVQRSTDGIRFTDIGMISANKGTTAYKYVDAYPGSGNNNYRLQLTSRSGEVGYSRIVILSAGAMADHAGLAPSVTAQSSTSLHLVLGKPADVLYSVTSLSGYVMLRNALRLSGGEHTLPLDISRLPGGVYFVHVTSGNGFNKTLTLVKR